MLHVSIRACAQLFILLFFSYAAYTCSTDDHTEPSADVHSSNCTLCCCACRFIASCSDMPDCSIRVWYADMPVPLSLSNSARHQESLYMRVRWSRSGLIKRIKMVTMQNTPKIFLTKQVWQLLIVYYSSDHYFVMTPAGMSMLLYCAHMHYCELQHLVHK
jgi:hypothetical protein